MTIMSRQILLKLANQTSFTQVSFPTLTAQADKQSYQTELLVVMLVWCVHVLMSYCCQPHMVLCN